MEDFVILIALSIAMFVGSYVAGSLPLVVPFSESRLRLITVLGAGLLVGTALAVIIPEGVQSIYGAAESTGAHGSRHGAGLPPAPALNAHDHDHGHNHGHGPDLHAGPSARNNQMIQQTSGHQHPQKKEIGNAPAIEVVGKETADSQSKADQGEKRPKQLPLPLAGMETRTKKKRDTGQKVEQKTLGESAAGEHGPDHVSDDDFPDQQHDDGHQNVAGGGHGHAHKADVHGTVGLALVAGFVLMLLVDQLAQQRSGRDVDLGVGTAVVQPRYKITATIGLVVHAAADGVALGAASSSSHSEIQLIVFVAIMLHKAPASFGLVTFLLHEGLDKARIRRHLLIFALAAPLAAVVTYFFIIHGGNKEQLSSMNTTGILLLFSAGTFLYVATVHVLPEVAAGGHHHAGGGGAGHHRSGFKLNELIALVFGAVAPTFLTLGHSH